MIMQKNLFHKNSSGFTLIELLIVIAIIGIPRAGIYAGCDLRSYETKTINS
jgi:prepilin-type N-terminal cleavage/methylation domain-containing protein